LNLSEIFLEFSNQKRLDIFKSLNIKPKRHNELEKEINLPGSEISRHLKRLLKKKLIYKRNINYELTNMGKIFIQIMDIFEVSTKQREYINSHDISIIPIHLILQMGNLKSIETSNKTIHNIELWSNLVKNSEQFIYAISDQFQNSLLPIVEKKINDQSLDIRALVDKNLLKSYNIPDEWSKQFQDPIAFYKKLNIYENVRILKSINFSLVVCDKGSIIFLSSNGEIDYNQCLIDNNESFIQWAIDLFEWYWKMGKSLKPFIKKEIQTKL